MESLSSFPFHKLVYDKYLTLDVMMYVEYEDAWNFMFSVCKKARNFMVENFITVRNGFINDGLIEFKFNKDPAR